MSATSNEPIFGQTQSHSLSSQLEPTKVRACARKHISMRSTAATIACLCLCTHRRGVLNKLLMHHHRVQDYSEQIIKTRVLLLNCVFECVFLLSTVRIEYIPFAVCSLPPWQVVWCEYVSDHIGSHLESLVLVSLHGNASILYICNYQ